MREIAFRFYDKKTGKLIEECTMWWNYIEHVNKYEVDVCQFTGLHDKNGKEIYEGDILEEFTLATAPRITVEWDAWSLFDDLQNGESEYLIVGNIYENPELLKGVKS